MLSKKEIQFIRSLKLKKHRQQYAVFIAEGEKWLDEIIKARYPVQHIYTTAAACYQKTNTHALYHGKVTLINDKTLQKISQLKTPNKVLCLLPKPAAVLNKAPLRQHITIVCDEVNDPGNMGSIIRTACWFGYPQIICSPNCVDFYNAKVVQATMGTLLNISLRTQPLLPLFEANPEIPVIASSLKGQPIKGLSNLKNGFLVIGNESKGVRQTILDKAEHQLKIEGSGGAESLNASVAAGILMFYFKG